MTFVFKEISDLEVELKRLTGVYKQDSIQKIHEPRRSELLYLTAILLAIKVPATKQLEEQKKLLGTQAELAERRLKLETPAENATTEVKAKFEREKAAIDEQITQINGAIEKAKGKYEDLLSVYYGAMLVARAHSKDMAGKLSTNIAAAVGIDADTKAENRPSLYLLARFHYAINAFLQYGLFPADRSIVQFNPKHLFSSSTSVRKEYLQELLVTGFELEERTQQELYADFSSIENSDAHVFELKKLTYAPTLKTIPDWKTLRTNLEELISAEITNSGVSTVSQLNDTRKAQIYFLKKIEKLLLTQDIALPEAETKSMDASKIAEAKDAERAAVLAGAMLLVHRQISVERTFRSTVYSEVERILQVSKMTSPDIEVLAQATNAYVRAASLVEVPESAQSRGFPKALKANNPFTTALDANDKFIITAAELRAFSNLSNTHIREMRVARLDKTMPTLTHTDAPAVEPPTSWLSGVGSALAGYGGWGIFAKPAAPTSSTAPASAVVVEASAEIATTTSPTMGGSI